MWSFSFTPEELQDFISEASANCYLGDFQKAETQERPGFFEMEYSKGEMRYRDSFVGYYRSTGQEIVRYNDIPIWATNYNGGVIDEYIGNKEFFKELELFLRTALAESDSDDYAPRGPKLFVQGDWEYQCTWEGDITAFSGVEHIYFKNEEVFYHNFFGGIIIGKSQL